MTRTCLGCCTVLPDRGRSPRCLACRSVHDRARKTGNVLAFRQRRRDFQPTIDGPKGRHLPNQSDVSWLAWLGLGLEEPVWKLCTLIRSGRAPYHPDVRAAARTALDQYDALRGEFDQRVLQAPQLESLWGEWRSFFEQLRGDLE